MLVLKEIDLQKGGETSKASERAVVFYLSQRKHTECCFLSSRPGDAAACTLALLWVPCHLDMVGIWDHNHAAVSFGKIGVGVAAELYDNMNRN